ncbi:MAG: deoxyribose-phosphate aldolase [Gemmatimonadales bacterium]|nr:deoxyribose-phosphate aldolase [Gemmatimonadales bacterium]
MSAPDLAALAARAEALVAAPLAIGAPATLAGPPLAAVIDHTLLRAEATAADVAATADEGRALGAASVCVNGRWVPLVSGRLRGGVVRCCAVVGFPLGAMAARAKAAEAAHAIADGAAELDMVVALGALLAGELGAVHDDIAEVVLAARGIPVKVILESAALSPLAIAQGCLLAEAAGAAFVKTSTGFHAAGGASVEAVALMRAAVGGRLGVKASGGIRTLADAQRMLGAGATRLGASATRAIVAGGAGGAGY